MTADAVTLAPHIASRLQARNEASRAFFPSEAPRLAEASRKMAERFRDGGRLLAFGHGPYATDAQHVAVEFVHPVIVGKRALPALDLSFAAEAGVRAVAQPRDIVMGFAPPEGDPAVAACLAEAYGRGCLTLALPGRDGHYAPAAPSADAFIHQEMIEILYHTLWETVHVFLEHRELGHEVGAAGFLYPFLGQSAQNTDAVLGEVAASIITKAQEDERLRDEIARSSAAPIADAALALHERLAAIRSPGSARRSGFCPKRSARSRRASRPRRVL
jgi:D-sedoheptulose 7-phosphate isomerase